MGKSKSKIGKTARQRGHSLEREVAKMMRDAGWPNAITRREARGGDWSHTDDGVDLVGASPLLIQCKRGRRPCSVTKLEEVQVKEGTPVLFTRGDRGPLYVVLHAEDFLRLAREVYGAN